MYLTKESSKKFDSIYSVFCVIVIQVDGFGKEGYVMKLDIRSAAFEEGESIPKKYTCDGADVSPQLSWPQPPEGTKSMALICDDPDAPMGTWVHWVLYGISPDTLELSENIPDDKEVLDGAKHGINDFRKYGYGGPLPAGRHTPLLSSYMQWIQRLP